MQGKSSHRIQFQVAEQLGVAVIPISKLKVAPSSSEFVAYERQVFAEIRSRWRADELKDDPVFRSYRHLYWRFGMDPTKTRVSSEAVLRRVLGGQNLWRVNNVVDTINLASAYTRIPISLIDLAATRGELVVRKAEAGETFSRIGGSNTVCQGTELVLADAEKIVCFGFATHDSELTSVRPETSDVLVVLYAAPAVTGEMLAEAADLTRRMAVRWLTGEVGQCEFYTNTQVTAQN
ncbi:MAG: hypothetical protein HXY34_03860 [Candidatus Thorarchaeota archaeon]|nr:hypothetical protein [Candidatus Thorarchaeota archaeon]